MTPENINYDNLPTLLHYTRAPQIVQATTACMERVLRKKRYRHYLYLWEQTDPQVEPKCWQSYYDAFYGEKGKKGKPR